MTTELQRPQHNHWATIRNMVNGAQSPITINCFFPVKQIKVRTYYLLNTGLNPYIYYITMPGLFQDGQIISVLSTSQGTYRPDLLPAANYQFFNNGTADLVTYTFREPQMVNGSYIAYLVPFLGIDEPTALDVIIHFELLG